MEHGPASARLRAAESHHQQPQFLSLKEMRSLKQRTQPAMDNRGGRSLRASARESDGGAQSISESPTKFLTTILTADLIFSSIPTFCKFLFPNVLAASNAPIQDCDEVFNYWEPTHYLNHGYGLQTWEYSPEYAIRSWLYIVLHAIPGKLGSSFLLNKHQEFYLIRLTFAFLCAGAETRLYSTISRSLNPRAAIIFMIAMLTTPGIFYASVAYLPSSFTMYTSMMGLAAFLDLRGKIGTSQGIMWFGIGATVGWPFSAALILPLFLDELNRVWLTRDLNGVTRRIFDGVMSVFIVIVSKPVSPVSMLTEINMSRCCK